MGNGVTKWFAQVLNSQKYTSIWNTFFPTPQVFFQNTFLLHFFSLLTPGRGRLSFPSIHWRDTSGVLYLVLGSAIQERKGHTGTSAEQDHRDDAGLENLTQVYKHCTGNKGRAGLASVPSDRRRSNRQKLNPREFHLKARKHFFYCEGGRTLKQDAQSCCRVSLETGHSPGQPAQAGGKGGLDNSVIHLCFEQKRNKESRWSTPTKLYPILPKEKKNPLAHLQSQIWYRNNTNE